MSVRYNSLTMHAVCVCVYACVRRSNVTCSCTNKAGLLAIVAPGSKLADTLDMPQQLPKYQINSNQVPVSMHKTSRQSPAHTLHDMDKLQTNENMEKLQRAVYTCATEAPLLTSLKQHRGLQKQTRHQMCSDDWEQHHS